MFCKKSNELKNVAKPVLADFGCSYPVLLMQGRNFFNCIGIEPDKAAREFGKINGIKMFEPQEFFDLQSDESVDIIRFAHVLEHIVYPTHILNNVCRKLKKGGVVYITQPSFPAYQYTKGFELKDSVYPGHLHFFNMISLTKMLEGQGLKVIKAFTHTGEQERYKKEGPLIDLEVVKEKMKKYQGDDFFGKENNFPYYCGENSFLVAIKK